MRKTENQSEMVFKDHYSKLPREMRTSLRDEFIVQSGMPFPSFYSKLKNNSFRPLELALFKQLLKKYQLLCTENLESLDIDKLKGVVYER